jgi:hypothetical protein
LPAAGLAKAKPHCSISWTHHSNEGAPVFALWGTNRYPGLESVSEDLYFYRLTKEYIERPQEAADRIISIAKALESVKA